MGEQMTLEQMEAIGKKAEQIKHALSRLKQARDKLELLKRHTVERKDFSVDMSWKPELILKKGDNYGYNRVAIQVEVPYAIVEQQLVDAVRAAEREVILLGGMP